MIPGFYRPGETNLCLCRLLTANWRRSLGAVAQRLGVGLDLGGGPGGLRSDRRRGHASGDLALESGRIAILPLKRRDLARERTAGPLTVRRAIRHEIQLCERELAADLSRLPGTDTWSAEDLRVVSNLIVTAMVATAEQLMESTGRPGAEKQIAETARTQLRMVLVGALNWESRG